MRLYAGTFSGAFTPDARTEIAHVSHADRDICWIVVPYEPVKVNDYVIIIITIANTGGLTNQTYMLRRIVTSRWTSNDTNSDSTSLDRQGGFWCEDVGEFRFMKMMHGTDNRITLSFEKAGRMEVQLYQLDVSQLHSPSLYSHFVWMDVFNTERIKNAPCLMILDFGPGPYGKSTDPKWFVVLMKKNNSQGYIWKKDVHTPGKEYIIERTDPLHGSEGFDGVKFNLFYAGQRTPLWTRQYPTGPWTKQFETDRQDGIDYYKRMNGAAYIADFRMRDISNLQGQVTSLTQSNASNSAQVVTEKRLRNRAEGEVQKLSQRIKELEAAAEQDQKTRDSKNPDEDSGKKTAQENEELKKQLKDAQDEKKKAIDDRDKWKEKAEQSGNGSKPSGDTSGSDDLLMAQIEELREKVKNAEKDKAQAQKERDDWKAKFENFSDDTSKPPVSSQGDDLLMSQIEDLKKRVKEAEKGKSDAEKERDDWKEKFENFGGEPEFPADSRSLMDKIEELNQKVKDEKQRADKAEKERDDWKDKFENFGG